MNFVHDVALIQLLGGIVGLLIVASMVGGLMRWRIRSGPNREMVDNINARIRAWWIMALVFATSVAMSLGGSPATVVTSFRKKAGARRPFFHASFAPPARGRAAAPWIEVRT